MTTTEAAGAEPAGAPEGGGAPSDDRDVVRRFAERGESTLHRLADVPGGQRALRAAQDMGRLVDELGRKVRGLDALEERIARLEREVAELRGEQPPD